jgi:hypothetical protein
MRKEVADLPSSGASLFDLAHKIFDLLASKPFNRVFNADRRDDDEDTEHKHMKLEFLLLRATLVGRSLLGKRVALTGQGMETRAA